MTLLDLPGGIDLAALRSLATGSSHNATTPAEAADGLVPAVSYLRVSTKDQATRFGQEEGLSIPAQREAVARKAEQLGAVIVKESIEPGESAKTARRRALQDMLEYVAANPVRYCIINKVDRLAWNRLDDAIIHATLRQAGVTLVSVTENIDESPSGMLMHGIMASIAEFYSLNLAQEVTKGLVQKATIGGTPRKAPIGYLNVRTTDGLGHEVRTIETDPDRADLIRYAFTGYATGNYSLATLATELETRGLATRPTPTFPARPVTTKLLHKILTNPYYQGIVTFRDVTYPGTHEPLVTPETFEQVQAILRQNHLVGDKPQKYDHYLKGTIYCACGKRLMFERPRNHQGVTYDYFTCTGRRLKKNDCHRTSLLACHVEDRIEAAYQRISITDDDAARIKDVLWQVFDALAASSSDERQPHHPEDQARSRTGQAPPSPLRRRDHHRPAQDRARPHPRQPARHHHPARRTGDNLRQSQGRTRHDPVHPHRPRRPLRQGRTSRTTDAQPGPVRPHHPRRRRHRDHHTQAGRRHDPRQRSQPPQRTNPAPRSRGAGFERFRLRGAKGVLVHDIVYIG